MVPMKAGNAGEDPGDPLEGRGEQTNVLGGGNMTILRNRGSMLTKHTRLFRARNSRVYAEFRTMPSEALKAAAHKGFLFKYSA